MSPQLCRCRFLAMCASLGIASDAAERWLARSKFPAANLALFVAGSAVQEAYTLTYQLGLGRDLRLDMRVPAAALSAILLRNAVHRWRAGPMPQDRGEADKPQAAASPALQAIVIPICLWLEIVRAFSAAAACAPVRIDC